MKNIIYSLFLTFSLIIYSNPVPIPIGIVVKTLAAPETSSATITVLEGSTTQIDLSSYTTGSTTGYSIVSEPVHKSTNSGGLNGNYYSYTHGGSEAPSDSFTFKASNSDGDSNTSTITINITNVNDAPTIDAIDKTVEEGSSVEITVIGKDAENAELTITNGNASNGTVTKDAITGLLTYTHNGSDTTSDSFTVTATELANTQNGGNGLLSGSATVSITITAVNDAPVVAASTIDVSEGGTSQGGSFNASDSDSQTLTSSVTQNPSNGTVTLDSNNPLNFTYTHDGSETKTDAFTYNISDGALSSSAIISVNVIEVNDAPSAVNDTYYISGGAFTVTKPGIGVLGNDVDPEENDFTAVLATAPTNGTLVLNPDGTFVYTPTINTTTVFNTDSFTYAAVDALSGAQGNAATVTFNLATLIPVPDSYALNEGETITVDQANGLIANDVDTNNFTIDSLWVFTQPKYGTITLNTDYKGGFTYVHDGSENLRDAFEYKVKNSNGDLSEKAFVNLFASNVNDAPTSTGTSVTLNEGAESTFSLSYSDSDSAADQITFTIASQPTNGNIIDLGSGSIRYIHNGGETTSDSFTYTVGDGEFTTAAATATITVLAVNDLPTASNLNVTVAEGGTSSAIAVAGTDIETNDNNLTFKLETAASNGTVAISSAGVWTYTHNGTETSTDSFTYSANDGTANGNPATVSITITSVDTSPVTTAVAIALNEGAAATYDLATNTTDSDTNSGITYTVVSAPSNGALTDPNNSNASVTIGSALAGSTVTYTHNGGETTSDTFTFKANDTNSDSNISTATVTVTAVNDIPTITATTDGSADFNVDEKDVVAISIVANDVDSTTLIYSVVTAPTGGTLTATDGSELANGNTIPGGTLTYTHTADITSNATDSFQVKVNDGTADSATATINLAITAIDESKPQVIIEAASSAVSEDAGTVVITASLVSNSFYSARRDMNAAVVSANAVNSLGYVYLGENGGHKYYLYAQGNNGGAHKNNSQAKADALAKGGYLVALETEAEETWLKDKVNTANFGNHEFWIGLNYKLAADAYQWINGATYSATEGSSSRWASGQPGNTSNQETNRGVTFAKDYAGWFTRPETNDLRGYVIEFDNSVNASAATTVNLTYSGNAQNTSGDSTADSGDDWTINANTITIANGASSATATVTVINDTTAEGNESIVITATAADNGVARVKGSKKIATIEIQDNELAVATMTTTATNATVTEGTDSSVDIIATLDFPKAFDSSIALTLSGTASSGTDYTSSNEGFVNTLSMSGMSSVNGVVVDASGNYYVGDRLNRYIYKMTPSGTVTTIGSSGCCDFETSPSPGSSAKFREIKDMDIDSNGKIYFTDGYSIRILDPSNERIYYVAGSNNGVNSDSTVPSGSATSIATDARFSWSLRGITVNAAGTIIYVNDDNQIKKISTSNGATIFTNSLNEDHDKTIVTNINHTNEWGRSDDGDAATSARFEGPRSIDTDSSGDIIVADYYGLKKLTVGSESSAPKFYKVLQKEWDEKEGLVIDSANNMYFSSKEGNYIYKYVPSSGSLVKVLDTEDGTVDGETASAKISGPRDIALHSNGNLVFVQNSDKKVREIDFAAKIRIPAGSQTGSYTLNIKDESFYEDNESIKIVGAGSGLSINPVSLITENSTDYLSFDSVTVDKTDDGTNGLTLVSDDSAPSVQVTTSTTSIEENGGVATVSFTIGGAAESGTKMDLDDGLKDEFIFIGNYQDHKYYIAQEWRSWNEAKDRATALGGYLLTISSQAENDFIQNNLGDYKWDSYWLGYSDTAEEGTFVWANGSDATYTNWNGGEPNNSGDEDVVEFNGHNGKWNDLNINDGRFFIIEFSGTISAKDVVVPYLVTRSSGFSETSGSGGDATFTNSGIVTIPAGQSKVDLTLTGINDSANEAIETITYTISNSGGDPQSDGTGSIKDGTYDSANSAVSISIIDDEAPGVTWASTAASFNENGGSVTITATSDQAKSTASKLNLTITDGGATQNKDYIVNELQLVNTFAGSSSGFKDGEGTDAKFDKPHGIASDSSGNIFVADHENNVIRKVTSSGVVTTYAGNGDWGHNEPSGNKLDVGLGRPMGITLNNAGDELYFSETGRQRITKINASGNISVISGNGDWGDAVGDKNTTQFQGPSSLAFDSAGNLYVGEDQKIKKLVVDGSGNWTSENFVGAGSYGADDGTGENAYFRGIRGIVIDKSGSEDVMYVADNNVIRKVTIPGGVVTTWANVNNNWGDNDGTLASAQMQNIKAITQDTTQSDLTLYIVDENKIKKVTNSGVESLAGGDYGYSDGTFASAKFREPKGMVVNTAGIYIADSWNNKIRKIDLLPSITIPAGQTTGSITINGIDDQLYESNDEAFTLSVSSISNVNASNSTYANIVTKITSDDATPIVKLSATDDMVDENGGTATIVLSLADAFSSAKSDMNASDRADFYYLGEYNGSKYYSSKNEDSGRKSYSEALSNATSLGGQLAVVTSAGENDFITSKIYEKDPEYNSENREWLQHWIGHAYDSTNSVWEWTNDAKSDYTNWGWEYNPNYIDRFYTQIRYRGLWFNGQSNWHSQYIVEFSSAISDADAQAVVAFSGAGTTGGDYTTSIGAPDANRTVTIPAGQSSANIVITGVDDSDDEAIEDIILTVSSPDAGANSTVDSTNNTATLLISDDEKPSVTLGVDVATIGEVSSEGVPVTSTLSASIVNAKLYPVDLSLDFVSSGSGIAIFGNDFGSDDLNRVTTLAGDGNDGYVDGDADEAEFSDGVSNGTIDAQGNIYVADKYNNVIRKIAPDGEVSTYAGTGNYWSDNEDIDKTDGNKLERAIRHPRSVKINGIYMYVVETDAHQISRINMSTGVLSRYVGLRNDQGDDNGNETEAKFNHPSDVAFDSANNMYVADMDNTKIRKVVDNGTNRIVTDYAGNGNWGDQDGDALNAELGGLRSLVVDSNDNLYFTTWNRIRKVSADGSTVSTIAGEWHDFADGYGTNAKFRDPYGLAIDGEDNIYVADQGNHRIRKISELSSAKGAKVETISGNGEYDYQDGTFEEAAFRRPSYVIYGAGALYVVDNDDNRIRKVQTTPKMTIPAGQTSVTYNISSINDVVYETDETIQFTSNSVVGGTLASTDPISLTLKSDELIPNVELDAESLVLNEADGTLELEVFLVDSSGASSNWEETELPSEASNDYEFMGEFEGNKYYFSRFSSEWQNANQNALDLGGQLLVIDSQSENEFINTIMIHNGTWLGTTRKQGEASWSNVYGTLEYENFEDNIFENEYGYALTYGNKWYRDAGNDYRHYIIEYGPVSSSELPSTVNLVFSDAGTATKGDAEDGTSDFKVNAETVTIPAGQQSATVTLTGLQDDNEEPIENILVSLALPETPAVALGTNTSLDIKIKDDEEPVVTFEASSNSISENGGEVILTANLSNAKLDPTVVTFALEGTATALEDYNVSSIFKYSSFVGKADEPGSRDGVGEAARLSSPLYITEYLQGTMLLADTNSHTIKLIFPNGTVDTALGQAFQCGEDVGEHENVRLCEPENIAVDMETGNVFWSRARRIYAYNANADYISQIFDGEGTMGWIGGLGFMNGDLYFTDLDRHTLNKLSWNGSSYDKSLVAGVENQSKQGNDENFFTTTSFDEASFNRPSHVTPDPANNRLFISMGYWTWNNWDQKGRIFVVDLDTNTISELETLRRFLNELSPRGYVEFGKPGIDSSGNLYIPITNGGNTVVKVGFNDDGTFDGVKASISNDKINNPQSVAVVGGSLYIANMNSYTVDKVGLGASVEIPAMSVTNNITLSAFKDPLFEEDELMDVNVASLTNATSADAEVADVTIVESTRLTLVADAPFEGVENGKVSWGDYDKDGDMDLALMGSASTGTITNVYKNNNGVFENTNQNFTKFIGGDIEFVDVNQDGWLDVAVGGFAEGNIRKSELYINQEGAFFELMEDYQVRGLSQVDMEWGDLDNDGDPDLIIAGIDEANEFMTLYYTNLGDFNFLEEGLFYDWGVINGEIDIVDADQDGDNDLFTNGTAGSVTNPQSHRNFITNTYYRDGYDEGENNNNNNNGGFNVASGFKNGNTIYADLDGDGELDFLAMGENYQGNIEKLSNLASLNSLPDLKNVDFDFADYNNDGQSDLIISGEDINSGAATTKLYVTFPEMFGSNYGLVDSGLEIAGLRSASTYWIDYDKDGDLDLFLTGLDDEGIAKSMLYKADNTNNLNSAPAKVANLTATDDGFGSVELKWDVPTDNTSSSFRYDIRIGTTSGASDIVYANSNIETGSTLINIPSLSTLNDKEIILNPGTYYASVQAIDGGNMGGAFSDEITFTLDYEWKQLNLGGIIDRRLLPTASTQLEFLDMDGDGDKDLISTNLGMRPMGSANQNQNQNEVNQGAINIYAFDNEVFKPVADGWWGESNFEFGDFNNDGEKDIIIAVEEDSGTRIQVLLNTRLKDDAREDDPNTSDRNEGLERRYFEEYNPFNGDNFFTSVYNIEFAIKDLDNDGLVEVIAAGQSSKLTNEATTVMNMVSVTKENEDQELGFNNFKFSEPKSVVDADKLNNLSFASYDFGDIDNDGDFDFLISGYSFDGYKTILFENKRKVDADGVTIQPIEVYFEEKDQSFVSVKSGTADFVDFDADGKLDVLFSGQSSGGDLVKAYKNGKDSDGDGKVDEEGYFDLDVGLPALREGKFVFGDFDSNGFADVVYSGTVSGIGKITKMAEWNSDQNTMVDSPKQYDLSYYQDANIGVGDFDGDMDADLLITGKNKFVNDINSDYQYISDVFINVRGFAGPGDSGVADSGSGYREGTPLKKSIGVKKTYGLNARPFPPTEVNFQRSRLGAVRPNEDGNGNKTSTRNGAADDSNEALFEMVISWSGAVDTDADGKKTPAEGLTYSVRIGTTPGGEEILASGSDIDGVKVAADKGNAENNLSWKVNVPEGDYYVSVQSIDASFIGSTFSPEQKYTVTSAFKLGDSNGDDGVNILDLTTNLDYILGNNPKVFVQEVADVNNDGKIDVTDISAIVNLILNGEGGVANGSNYDPYDWDYFSDVPVGDATLVHTNNRVFLENDKPVTSLQFSMDATVDYELSEALDNMSVVTYVEDGKRTFLIYSYNNQPINELTNVVFDYIDVNENEEFEIGDLSAGTSDGLVLDLKYSDERFFDSMDESIKMYPNPVISNLNLLTDLTKNVERLDVNIYNVLGVSVYNTTIDSMGRLNDLDVSMLSSGLYTVQVRMVTTDSEEIISVHKLIKK